ncbi:hypothetical protein C9I57_18720 [Trinickia symbiotica]|uniref:Uncharacterized protein n=1 Tax=Trinickia symbiotica TaxID=863227 RepID=A0A2T3XRH2_9BURK|nr:hypothetical protein C9I57_18720 [Trinickia symbiotica]
MAGRQRSLRRVVESWLGTHGATDIRVTRFSGTRRKRCRCVRVEASGERGKLAILFFRHDDGSWCVFPPAPSRPFMGAEPETHVSLQ